ncbi:amino acid/amide ABC transporter substrate-binding protein, HAAT family [Caenispirillum bisanense]|uniref:Amino acid/amide ABC transporter substrate-binding protein, HAAT family n=1 Tax=Caenispirillum bisanense TaxID=414052 RepID=A0A286GED5_9PROT|nr:ABC transporter substrate-binding protein [Caenispirillum bisanense]SOD93858.1 amino acid/amide ABC transporter substrate-binding protein, HAAT family [Caenispirillum bisanense]
MVRVSGYVRSTLAAVTAAVAVAAGPAQAADTIKVGEINSYTALPAFTEPYKKGWELALEQINAAGGVNGAKIEVISKDDAGKPGDAVTAANELVSREGVDLLMGTFFSHIGLAVADYAKQRQVFFVAAEPLTDAIVWQKGNDYTFRLRPSVYMQANMLADEAAKLPAKRWATVAPNYEYGTSAVAAFKEALTARRPDIQWVEEQWPPQGKIDAGSVVQALARSEPEAIFNVTFGPDLIKLVREGTTRGLFEGREVVSLLTGEPEYIDPLGAETPEGWIVTGYPWDKIDTPEHKAFLDAYQAKFNDYPRLGSIVGYATMMSVGEILKKAGSTETPALIEAAKGIAVATPLGPITYRAVDHQSTLGAFVGRTAVVDGKGTMVDFEYRDGADYLPPPDEVRLLRATN